MAEDEKEDAVPILVCLRDCDLEDDDSPWLRDLDLRSSSLDDRLKGEWTRTSEQTLCHQKPVRGQHGLRHDTGS